MISTSPIGPGPRFLGYHFLLLFALVGCGKSVTEGPAPESQESSVLPADEKTKSEPVPDRISVLQVVEKIKSDRNYYRGPHYERAIQNGLAASNMDAKTLYDGCIGLLKRGTAKEKETVAAFLGHFGDRDAIGPLVTELDHPDEKVRKSVCFALRWLDAKGEILEARLLKLCQKDPSPGVRVSAAFALQGSHQEDAIAAYQSGLESTDRSLWLLCEEELAWMWKLKLPLPEHIYTKTSPAYYKGIKANGRIGRVTKKNGTIYFEEARGGHDGIPLWHEWYKVTLPENPETPKEP